MRGRTQKRRLGSRQAWDWQEGSFATGWALSATGTSTGARRALLILLAEQRLLFTLMTFYFDRAQVWVLAAKETSTGARRALLSLFKAACLFCITLPRSCKHHVALVSLRGSCLRTPRLCTHRACNVI